MQIYFVKSLKFKGFRVLQETKKIKIGDMLWRIL